MSYTFDEEAVNIMNIDSTTKDLVCIQIREDERSRLEDGLRDLSNGNQPELRVTCDNGSVVFRLVPSGIQIDCSNRRDITIQLCKVECNYLADAIAEQVADSSGLPLDHSFEALGASISPAEIKDVVVETMGR